MIDAMLQESADQFVRVLSANPAVSAYQEAKASLETDEEFLSLRNEHARMIDEFRRRQSDGTLAPEDIANQRKVFARVSKHPANLKFLEAQAEMLAVLRHCNDVVSELLGFDFAVNAAPASCC